MTIYILKSEDGQYVKSANARLRVNNQTRQAQLLEKPILQFTNNINEAQLIENPNFEEIKNWNLCAILVSTKKPKLKEVGNIYEITT